MLATGNFVLNPLEVIEPRCALAKSDSASNASVERNYRVVDEPGAWPSYEERNECASEYGATAVCHIIVPELFHGFAFVDLHLGIQCALVIHCSLLHHVF